MRDRVTKGRRVSNNGMHGRAVNVVLLVLCSCD